MNPFGKSFECQQCGTKFRSESDLMEHGQMHMAQGQDHAGHEHFTCNACGTSFHSKAELEQHGQKYHM
jgi:uncharacterized C2H2 Zn-finger protein